MSINKITLNGSPQHFLLLKPLGFFTKDGTTPIFKNTYDHACISAKTALKTAALLRKKGGLRYYSLTLNPGHHASEDKYDGYSFLNNAALAIKELLPDYPKIATIDVDVHAGNGTQKIFYRSNKVFTGSIHSDPTIEFPHVEGFECEVGKDEGKGFNMNLTFTKKINFSDYIKLVEILLKRIESHEPDLVVIPFGADTYQGDVEVNSLAGANLEVKDYFTLGALISKSIGKKPILVTQEGGYCIEKVGAITSSFLQGLCTM